MEKHIFYFRCKDNEKAMNKKDFFPNFAKSVLMGIGIGALMLCVMFVCALLSGCKGKERVVYSVRTDSVYFARVDTFTREVVVRATDTIKVADSVYLREYVTVKVNEGGDTVWRDRVVYRDRWRDAVSTSVQAVAASEKEKAAQVLTEVKTDTVYIEQSTQSNGKRKKSLTQTLLWLGLVLVLTLFLYKNRDK